MLFRLLITLATSSLASKKSKMISEQECIQILNQGEIKYSKEEVKLIRELLISLATIEYEEYKQISNQ